jgi:hypothetical protein
MKRDGLAVRAGFQCDEGGGRDTEQTFQAPGWQLP